MHESNVFSLKSEEKEDNKKSLYCLDPTAPCKCVSIPKVFVDEKLETHRYITHACANDQDNSIFDKVQLSIQVYHVASP